MKRLFAITRPFGLLLISLAMVLLLSPLGLVAEPAETAIDLITPIVPISPIIPTPTPSAGTMEHLTTISEIDDLTVGLWYDVGLPEVTLIAPSGMEYSVSTETAGINVMIEAQYALVQIPMAEAGEWYIRYTMGDNTEFEYQLMGKTENIWIQYITAEPTSNNRIDATFLATLGDEQLRYQYQLYLTYDDPAASTVLLREGSAYTGVVVSLSLSLANFNSYDSYQLLLEVEIVRDEVTLFDNLKSETFAFENDSSVRTPTSIEVSVNLSERMVTADWSILSYRYDGYRVVITDSATGEVVYSVDLDSTATQMTQYIAEKISSASLSFYGKRDSLLSEPLTREIHFDGALEIITETPTASSQAQLKMNLPAETVLNVGVGDVFQDFVSEGKENIVAVPLENGGNELVATYLLNEVSYKLTASLYKDGYPPQIDFYEPYHEKVFPDGKATLMGSVGDAVSLSVNGKEVELSEGAFRISLDLETGENEYVFEAKDAVGNLSSYRLTLYGVVKSASSVVAGVAQNNEPKVWIPIVIGCALGAACIVFAIVLAARKKHLKTFSTTSLIVFFSGTTIATLAMFIWQLIRKEQMTETANSYGFIEIVRDSLDNAYEFLIELQSADSKISLWLWIFLGSLGALLTVVLIHVIVLLITRRKRAKTSNAPQKKKKKSLKSAKPIKDVVSAPKDATESVEQSATASTEKAAPAAQLTVDVPAENSVSPAADVADESSATVESINEQSNSAKVICAETDTAKPEVSETSDESVSENDTN